MFIRLNNTFLWNKHSFKHHPHSQLAYNMNNMIYTVYPTRFDNSCT